MTSQTDRGWAWVVMLATFGSNYLTGVLIFSIGVLNVALLDKFQDDVTTTSWVGAINISLMYFAAPLAMLCVNTFGCRITMLTGGIILCIGYITSAFVTSVWHLFLTYGLISGVGLAFTLNPGYIIIAYYFEKYRGLAAGISQAGISVGILSGSLITQTLIDTYGLQGAFLITAGVGLQICPLGALLRPTQYEEKGEKDDRVEKGNGKKLTTEQQIKKERETCGDNAEKSGGNVSQEDSPPSSRGSLQNKEAKTASECRNKSADMKDKDKEFEAVTELCKEQDGGHDFKSSAETNEQPSSRGARLFVSLRRKFQATVPLWKNGAFVVHCLHMFFVLIPNAGVVVHLQEYARTEGTPPAKGATLFIGIGVLNLFSVLLTGFLTTGNKIHPLHVSIALAALGGAVITSFPLYSATYAGQMVFSCLYGLAVGGFFPLINILTAKLVGVEMMATALSVEGICMGLGNIVGPPLAGLFVDNGGTYDHSFIFLGLCYAMAAICDVIAKIILFRRKGHNSTA